MNLPYSKRTPSKRLNSPLLDIGPRYENQNKNNEKKLDESLDKIFSQKDNKNFLSSKKEDIDYNIISSTETIFKVTSIFSLSIGSIFILLESVNIGKSIYYGDPDFQNNLILVILMLVAIIFTNIICHGFIHLSRATKHIYKSLEKQTYYLEKLYNELNY